MRHIIRATVIGLALVLASSASAMAQTTRIPFSSVSISTVGFQDGTYRFAGQTMHVTDLVVVFDQDMTADELDGILTVHVNYVLGSLSGSGDAMWGTEELASSMYPGEGFRCTMSGGWDKTGVRNLADRCLGYGDHLSGWQFRSWIVNDGSGDQVTGILFRPGI